MEKTYRSIMEVFGIFQLLLSLSPDPTTNSEIPIPNFFKYGHDFADKKENKNEKKWTIAFLFDNPMIWWLNLEPLRNLGKLGTQPCFNDVWIICHSLSFCSKLVSMIIFSPRANNVEINLLILEKNVKTPNKYEIEAANGDYLLDSNFYYIPC